MLSSLIRIINVLINFDVKMITSEIVIIFHPWELETYEHCRRVMVSKLVTEAITIAMCSISLMSTCCLRTSPVAMELSSFACRVIVNEFDSNWVTKRFGFLPNQTMLRK